MLRPVVHRFVVLAALLLSGLFTISAQAATYKVLAVMSYDQSYAWVKEITEGINYELEDTCEIKYFYMNTKKNLKGGPQKAKEAYSLYQEFLPDGVIAADDNAQSMFVVPYLKDKVKTPVMFCGVNAEAEKYGYPASNVSGILERMHIRSSIAFAQQLDPSIKSIGYLMKESPSARAVFEEIKRESKTYPAKSLAFKSPNTLNEAVLMTKKLKKQCDALFIAALEGIQGYDGIPLSDRVIIPILAKTFGKPIISNTAYHVKNGTLCAVVKTGLEQGQTSAKMLLKAMQGTPVSKIPTTRNQKGKKMLNVTVMKELGIKPKPILLQETELVATTEKFKVLVVMSYEETYPPVPKIKEGVDSILGDICEIKYFYMNTKKNLKDGPQKAKEAYSLYQEFLPDGVITADDNAQSMFAVP